MGVITFNGRTSTSIGLQVETPPDYDIPERIYELIHVPGRNGDIAMDTGAYKNSNRPYVVSIGQERGDFSTLAGKLVGWLHSAPGYLRLEDSYNPNHYFMAKYSESNNIVNILQQAGKATITFDRKPQKFLKTGDNAVTVANNGVINNPTSFDSKPLIKINGSGTGTLKVGNYNFTITNISAYMYLDTDLEDAYKDAINMSQYVTAPQGYALLKPGDNKVIFSGGITSIQITPRWWTL